MKVPKPVNKEYGFNRAVSESRFSRNGDVGSLLGLKSQKLVGDPKFGHGGMGNVPDPQGARQKPRSY